MKKAGNIILNVLIVLISVMLISVLILRLCFHVQLKAVVSGSMEPELPVGSLLIIVPAEYDDIVIGDDVTYVRDENLNLVTHRVVKKDPARMTLTTKGIANNTIDAPVRYDNVLGRVWGHIPLIGWFGIWLSTPAGIIIAITAVISLVIIILLIRVLFFPAKAESKSSEEEQPDGTEEPPSDEENAPGGEGSPERIRNEGGNADEKK